MLDKTITGKVSSPLFNTPIIYTDGSVSKIKIRKNKNHVSGWGYVGTDGQFGVGTYIQPTVTNPPVIAELKAIYRALTRYSITDGNYNNRFIIVYSDSMRAIGYINRWRKGDKEMPELYTGRTLREFRERLMSSDFNFEIIHVKGHSGDTLNECADSLAHLGMKWSRDRMDRDVVEKSAIDIAESFLNNPTRVKI